MSGWPANLPAAGTGGTTDGVVAEEMTKSVLPDTDVAFDFATLLVAVDTFDVFVNGVKQFGLHAEKSGTVVTVNSGIAIVATVVAHGTAP